MSIFYPLSPFEGRDIYLAVKDCAGEWCTAEDFTSVDYTVYEVNLGEREAVTGHTSVNVPLSSFQTPAASPHTTMECNFHYRISGVSALPFPSPSTEYLIVFRFFQHLEPYTVVIYGRTE